MCFINLKEDETRNFLKLHKTYGKRRKGKQREWKEKKWRGLKGRGGAEKQRNNKDKYPPTPAMRCRTR